MKLSCLLVVGVLFVSQTALGQDLIAKLQTQSKVNTQVLILGSTHLSQVKNPIDKQNLAPVLKVLADFQPTAVAVEVLRPQDIVTMINGAEEYQAVLKQFVGDTFLQLAKQQQQRLGVSATQAMDKLEKLLQAPQAKSELAAQIINMAVAAYDKSTAVLHWQYLQQANETRAISQALKDYLNALLSSNKENILIATELAFQQQLNRLYAIDDHLDKDIYPQMQQQLMQSFSNSKDVKAFMQSDYAKMTQVRQDKALESGDWLGLYTWFNSPEYMSQVLNKEWKLFIDSDIDAKAGAARIALWEVRNLNMASNIMRIAARQPGGKILVVVGANHKVFLEQYLANMLNINIVQFNQLVNSK